MIYKNSYVWPVIESANIVFELRLFWTKGEMYFTLLKGTMSHLQAPKNEKVKFQLHLKDNTNSELP